MSISSDMRWWWVDNRKAISKDYGYQAQSQLALKRKLYKAISKDK